MSEVMDTTYSSFPPENGEPYIREANEEQIADFRLEPYNEANFPEGRLAILRAGTATAIKDSLQDFTRLDDGVREFREVSTRSDYIWAIISDLGMTKTELPTKEYRNSFTHVHEKAKNISVSHIGELMDKHENHPALGFIDTLVNISPKTRVLNQEYVMLKRSLLVLLDENS